MRDILIALSIAIIAVVLSTISLSYAGVPKEFAPTISSTLMAFVPNLHKIISQHFKKKAQTHSIAIVDLREFGLPTTTIVILGSSMLFGTLQFSSALGGFTAILTAVPTDRLGIILGIFVFTINLPVSYFIGRWCGRRCSGNGIIAVCLIAFITRVTATTFDFTLVPIDLFEKLFEQSKNIWSFIVYIAFGFILFSVTGLIGYWRGRRQRLSYYLGYLLKSIPQNSRDAIVELAYEEAKKSLAGVPH